MCNYFHDLPTYYLGSQAAFGTSHYFFFFWSSRRRPPLLPNKGDDGLPVRIPGRSFTETWKGFCHGSLMKLPLVPYSVL